jgi:hypothetical protein
MCTGRLAELLYCNSGKASLHILGGNLLLRISSLGYYNDRSKCHLKLSLNRQLGKWRKGALVDAVRRLLVKNWSRLEGGGELTPVA